MKQEIRGSQRVPGTPSSRGVSARGLLIAATALQLVGCVTIGRFEEMEARVNELEQKQAQVAERTDMHENRIENLNTILKRSEADLREGYAATTSTVDELDDRLRKTLGTLESTQFQVERDSRLLARLADFLDKQYGTTLAALPDNLPQDGDKLVAMGQDRLKPGQWREARAIFREYLNRDAQGPHAAQAQMLIGESFVGENDHDRALGEFKAVWSAYRDSPLAPKALLRIGQVLEAKKECGKAKAVYQLLIREAKDSEAAKKAKTDLKTLGTRCSG